MPAEGREDTLLGVAFENPYIGTLGKHAPQGIEETDVEVPADASGAQATNAEDSIVVVPGAFPRADASQSIGALEASTPSHANTQSSASQSLIAAQQTDEEEIGYWSPCPWPKDLVKKIYPNKPIEATGVEAVLEKVHDHSIRVSILDAIKAGLHIRSDDLDTTTIPIFRRWTMEDPWSKVNGLLHKPEYRSRLIALFEEQLHEKKLLYIATNIIACGKLGIDKIKKDEQELEADALKDPTNTVPVKVGGKLHHIKRTTLKGTYESDVVLCMSYCPIRYMRVTKEQKDGASPGGWLGGFFRSKDEKPKFRGAKAIRFNRADGGEDVFYFKDQEVEGNAPAWMSVDAETLDVEEAGASESVAIFEDARLVDTTAGAEQSESEIDLPSDFFSPPDPGEEVDSDDEEYGRE
jgi:hypothetical protein